MDKLNISMIYWSLCNSSFVSFWNFWQVDLFFYRDPEETKQEETEDVPALTDYADYTAAAGGDWSSAQIPDSQWVPEIAGAIPPVAAGWTADAGLYFLTKLYKIYESWFFFNFHYI